MLYVSMCFFYLLYQVGEGLFHLSELSYRQQQDEKRDGQRQKRVHTEGVGCTVSNDAPTETIYDRNHWIEIIQHLPFFGNDAAAESDGRNIQTELNNKRYNVPKIPIFDIQCR